MRHLIIVRGGGDIATGTIHRLWRCGFHVLVLECERPSAIRREVAFCEAVYDGDAEVEGAVCRRIEGIQQCQEVWEKGEIPLLVDTEGRSIAKMQPFAVVDAILAKKNLGMTRDMAPLTIGLGPGFTAGKDVDYAVETMRGHDLGRIITQGSPLPNTGIPGDIAGYGKKRVIHAPAAGILEGKVRIGDFVTEGQVIARIGNTLVFASLTGILRGIIRNGYHVHMGMKIADIDPREDERKNCYTISDKARCIAGSVLEIIVREHSGDY